VRKLAPEYLALLKSKDQALIDMMLDIREYFVKQFPECNELLYHTHALTWVLSPSERLGDAFCHVPIYTAHLNLGFNDGTSLEDPHGLLTGTGKRIRHIDVKKKTDYRNAKVKALMKEAHAYSLSEMKKPPKVTGEVISKIKH